MNKPVVTTSTTDHQIREIDDSWRENRDKSPDLFAEELALAFRMLEASIKGSGPDLSRLKIARPSTD